MTDRLEKAGYVRRKRDPTDRRLIYIKPLLDKAMIKMGRRQDQMKETVFEGLENAPKAFIALFNGENFGKTLLKIGHD